MKNLPAELDPLRLPRRPFPADTTLGRHAFELDPDIGDGGSTGTGAGIVIHPIPNGYFCVPAALAALTGEPLDAVLVPAINRHAAATDLIEAPAGVSTRVVRAVLEELGYAFRPYRAGSAGPLRARLATWLARSTTWPDRSLYVTTVGRGGGSHALAVRNGLAYDNHVPLGANRATHPFRTAIVDSVAWVERRA